MKVLVVPMFALATMGGPWSRALAISKAFESAGHKVLMGVAPDGNCKPPADMNTFQMSVPSPMGLPHAISSRTFPIANRLGVAGRMPVKSLENVLHFTGALDYRYLCESVEAIRKVIRSFAPDAVYSEFNLSAILAARIEGVPVFGSFSYTTRAAYACAPKHASGVRRFVQDKGLPPVDSSLELFDWLERKFVPSCPSLEPFDDPSVVHCGFLKSFPEFQERERDAVLVYMGNGSVGPRRLERVPTEAFPDASLQVLVVGAGREKTVGNVSFARHVDFSKVLPKARAFVNHSGQNSIMDGIAYCVPQIMYPGRVFERAYNARSVETAGAGIDLSDRGFNADSLRAALSTVESSERFQESARALKAELASLGGAGMIVQGISDAPR